MASSYTLDWTNPTLKPSFLLPVGVIDSSSTSLSLSGRDTANWGERLQENMLRIMENFASPIAPPAPTWGQLWYDTGAKILKMYKTDGTWVSIWIDGVSVVGPAPTPAPAPAFTAASTTSIIAPASIVTNTYVAALDLVITAVSLSSVSLLSGAIPSGMTLSSNTNAYIIGTPSVAGTYTGVIRVTQITSATPAFLDRSFFINVSAPGAAFTLTPLTTSLAPVTFTKNSAYTSANTITAITSSNITIDSVILQSGSIPAGMILTVIGSSIRVTGTPTVAGSYSGTIQAAQTQPGYSPANQASPFFITVVDSNSAGVNTASFSNGGSVTVSDASWVNIVTTTAVSLTGINLTINYTNECSPPLTFESGAGVYSFGILYVRLINAADNAVLFTSSGQLGPTMNLTFTIPNITGRSYRIQANSINDYSVTSNGYIRQSVLNFTGV